MKKENVEQKSIKSPPVSMQEENLNASENVKINVLLTVFFGALVGLVSGLFGGGGGMIAVPVLTGMLKKPQKVAHATALLVILPITIISSVLYSVFGNFDVKVVPLTTLGVILGGVLGAICLKKFSNSVVRIIFSIVMLAFGLRLIFM